jgi:hypothetical protein
MLIILHVHVHKLAHLHYLLIILQGYVFYNVHQLLIYMGIIWYVIQHVLIQIILLKIQQENA